MAQPQTDHYFVPAQSKAPIMASVALFTLMIGVASWLNGVGWGKPVFFHRRGRDARGAVLLVQ